MQQTALWFFFFINCTFFHKLLNWIENHLVQRLSSIQIHTISFFFFFTNLYRHLHFVIWNCVIITHYSAYQHFALPNFCYSQRAIRLSNLSPTNTTFLSTNKQQVPFSLWLSLVTNTTPPPAPPCTKPPHKMRPCYNASACSAAGVADVSGVIKQ